jgi:DNA-binding CsgD family transcriptional regulator/tetratricopeptide (TPR) repeat protein
MRTPLPQLPFVGRGEALERLDVTLDAAAGARGAVALITGPGGVGKSRLAAAAAELARRRGFTVAHGRSYPVETGVPYALFADALLPALRELDPAALAVLARGGEAELAYLLPALAPGERTAANPGEDPAEFKTRLLWIFTDFLRRFADRRPLLLLLEDLHWADASSLELLHFVARQTTGDRIAIVCSFADAEPDGPSAIRTFEQSLASTGLGRAIELGPLDAHATLDLVCRAFEIDGSVAGEFAALLYRWTRGNPFFIQEMLHTLVESGRLVYQNGQWLGWEVGELELPRSVRASLLGRLDRLGGQARATADLSAVIGTRITHAVLRSVSPLGHEALLAALDELRAARVLEERTAGRAVVYDFTHPLIRETLYVELGIARARLLHAGVAEALETHHGDDAMAHADELAYHFARAEAESLAPKAIRYLVEAGRRALDRFANREAADYLALALERVERTPESDPDGPPPAERDRLRIDLARARARLGDHAAAVDLLRSTRDAASVSGDAVRVATLERRLGLTLYWSGRPQDAIEHFCAGLAALDTGHDPLRASLLLARGTTFLDLGDAAAGLDDVQSALGIAERIGEPPLLARVHRGLVQLYTWAGQPQLAREHGARAVELADCATEPTVAFGAHWALAVLEGLIGDTAAMRIHVDEAERLANDLRSPLLWLAVAETSIEYYGAIGEWDTAIGIGERAIALGHSLNANVILPRLLVWTALLHLARGDTDRAQHQIDEAWTLSSADDPDHGDVHAIVSAHIGRAASHLWRQEYRDAIRIGEEGLRVADRSGYVFWALHRLLPIVTEANCYVGDLEGARRAGNRLRTESRRLGHKLGMAWADSADAVLAWLAGDPHRGAELLRGACEALDAIPIVADAARLRRQLAGRLAEIGDREGAIHELRRVHDVFARLGIERELDKTRGQFRELGAKPPGRSTAEGTEALTGREVEIARLVAARNSNKAIGKKLGISARTVSTHLSNVFRKLGVESRGELADFVKAGGLIET